MAVAATAPLILPTPALAVTRGARRTLAFQHLHTGERVRVTYWQDGRYLPKALAELNHHLRDWRTGEVTRMDPELLDLVWDLRRRLRSDDPVNVISAYRCPQTNAMLAANSDGVASHSLHMDGKAIDIALPNRKLAKVRQAALDLKRGGVGYYPRSGFVHVDTGRFRQWV